MNNIKYLNENLRIGWVRLPNMECIGTHVYITIQEKSKFLWFTYWKTVYQYTWHSWIFNSMNNITVPEILEAYKIVHEIYVLEHQIKLDKQREFYEN